MVNKWDLVQKDTSTLEHYEERIHEEMKTLDYMPILFVSALTGQRVSKIFAAIEEVVAEYRKRIPTAELNAWLKEAVQSYSPPLYRNRPVKLYYISQVAVAPPTFVLFTNEPRGIGESYQRYLTRRLRENYGFTGTPLRLLFRHRRKELP
jgi:GTP-binding protein